MKEKGDLKEKGDVKEYKIKSKDEEYIRDDFDFGHNFNSQTKDSL